MTCANYVLSYNEYDIDDNNNSNGNINDNECD